MTRSDGIGAGVTLVGIALGWFIKGRTVALICGAVGMLLILILHIFSRQSTSNSPPVTFSRSFTPNIEQKSGGVGNVRTGDLNVNVYPPIPSSAAVPAPTPQAPEPQLEILTPPAVWPIGWNGSAWMEYPNHPALQTGIFVTIINKPAKPGMDGALAEDLTATIEFSENGKRLELISTACWRGYEQNRIDLQPGGKCPLFLGHIHDEAHSLIVYDNPRVHARIPPRSMSQRALFYSTPIAPPNAAILTFQSGFTVEITVVSQETHRTLLQQRLNFRRIEKTIKFVEGS